MIYGSEDARFQKWIILLCFEPAEVKSGSLPARLQFPGQGGELKKEDLIPILFQAFPTFKIVFPVPKACRNIPVSWCDFHPG
jgi:hypothetical protein